MQEQQGIFPAGNADCNMITVFNQLEARGLSEERAKQLITFGYLKPILKGFDDEQIIAHIEDKIEGNI